MNLDFFQLGPIPSDAMSGYYNGKLVLLSYIVAVLASLVVLEISQEIRRSKHSIFWLLIGGACAMGAGIFSMHFVGMLAYIMPMPARYNFFLTTLSLVIAIVASGFAFYLVRHPESRIKHTQIILGGCILGLAIASMHYTGMAAMVGVKNTYLPGLFSLSILVAVAASITALYLMIECGKGSLTRQRILKTVSILIMGAAVCGMHYIGMEASVMTPAEAHLMESPATALSPERLSFYIAFTASSIMIIALLLTGYKHLILVKILIGIAITPLLLTPVATILLQNIQDVNAWSETISKELIPPMRSLLNMQSEFCKAQHFISVSSSQFLKEEWLLNHERLSSILANMKKSEDEYFYQKKKHQGQSSFKRKDLHILEEKLMNEMHTIIQLMETEVSQEAIINQYNALKSVQDSIEKFIQKATVAEFSLIDKWGIENKPPQVESGYTYIIIILVVFLFSLFVSVLIALDITNLLKKAVLFIKRLTLGDVNFHIENYSNNEIGQLLQAMNFLAASKRKLSDAVTAVSRGDLSVVIEPRSNEDSLGLALVRMVKNLKSINGEIQDEVKNLTLSSEEISNSISEVTKSSTETATTIAETKTSVDELKQIAHVTDDKAKDVLNNSQITINVVATSENLLQATINDMEKINEKMRIISESIVKLGEHNKTIGEIIDSVNDLAEQSNLLAVNAAIEAAIAGEYGKGFAIVAKEIRALAEQSKAATQQIRSILSEIQNATAAAVLATEQGTKAVENGVRQSAQTNESMQVLAKSVTQVTQAANQIAVSSQQQFLGVEQLTTAMNSINAATMHLVDHMQSIESSVTSLKLIGCNLKGMTDRYIMEKDGASHGRS